MLRVAFLAVVLASQSEVTCICTLTAFYHMAKQHSKGVSTQATDGTTVQSSVQYIYVHTAAPHIATNLLDLLLQIHFLIRNRAEILA